MSILRVFVPFNAAGRQGAKQTNGRYRMGQTKLDYVDVLRGIAILGVLWLHFSGDSGFSALLPESLVYVVQQGGRGVQLFFVASAFTLFRSYTHRAPLEENADRNFFIRRYFRIAPMYYVGMLYYLWQDGFGPRPFLDAVVENTPGNIVANVFFLHEFNPYYMWLVPGSWSIATEMMFYLLVPLLFRWIPDLGAAIRFVLLSLVIRFGVHYALKALALVPEPVLWESYLYFILPGQLPVFALGVLLFFVMRGDAWPRLPKFELLAWAGVAMADFATGGGRVIPHQAWFGMAFVIMAVAFSRMDWSHLPGRVIRHIGKVSFSMYILHWGLLHWGQHLGWVQLTPGIGWGRVLLEYGLRFVAVVAVATLLSTLTYKLIEEPGQKLGQALILRWDRRRAGVRIS